VVTRRFYLITKRWRKSLTGFSKGQAIVEFSLLLPFLLLLVGGAVDWGLVYFTSHIAQNAAREGARIAVTLPDLEAGDGRVSSTVKQKIPDISLFSNFKVSNTAPEGPTCGKEVTVTVDGTYNFTFMRIIGLTEIPLASKTRMRYEHQEVCTS